MFNAALCLLPVLLTPLPTLSLLGTMYIVYHSFIYYGGCLMSVFFHYYICHARLDLSITLMDPSSDSGPVSAT